MPAGRAAETEDTVMEWLLLMLATALLGAIWAHGSLLGEKLDGISEKLNALLKKESEHDAG